VRCGLMSLELHRLRHHDRFLDLGEKSWWLADKIEDDPRVCLPPSAAMDRDQLTGSLWSPQRSTHPARRFYMLRIDHIARSARLEDSNRQHYCGEENIGRGGRG